MQSCNRQLSCWPTLKSPSHDIIHLFKGCKQIVTQRYSPNVMWGAEYIPKHINFQTQQLHAHSEHCTHSCIALVFILSQKGMVLLLNVLCYRCTVKGKGEHDGPSICHHEGMRTATAKSYPPGGRAGETNGLFVLRALATEHGIQKDS